MNKIGMQIQESIPLNIGRNISFLGKGQVTKHIVQYINESCPWQV